MISRRRNPSHTAWPHYSAWLLLCATFPLIWWGGFVTSTDAGMAFRDWLTSDGYFMLSYPWLTSTGDKFIEHGHRLLGFAVGLLTILLVAVVHFSNARRSVRVFSWVLLAAVIAQGVLGGLRVVLDQRTLALLHGCTGPLFFAMCTAMVVATSATWQQPRIAAEHAGLKRLARLALVVAGLTYLQLVLGAIVRHAPHLTTPLAASLFQTAVYLHVLLAAVILCYVLSLAWQSWRVGVCRKLGASLPMILGCQLALGVATWVVKYGIPHWAAPLVGEHNLVNVEASLLQATIVTSHVAFGSLIVATAVATAMFAARQVGWRIPLASASVGMGMESVA